VYPEEFCEPEVPTLSRPCKSPKCQAQWFSSEWSKCSAPCGKGVKSRIVLCGEFNGMTVSPASDDSKCDKETKPESEQECEGEEKECPGEWFTGPWGKCSKPCGKDRFDDFIFIQIQNIQMYIQIQSNIYIIFSR